MSGVKRPSGIPYQTPVHIEGRIVTAWVGFFRDLVSKTPQVDELHLPTAGIIYFGDDSTNGSWRIVRSGNDLVIQRREADSWVTKSTISA